VSANLEFFASKKSAAVFKHGILKRYPVVFAVKTGQRNGVLLLDGYAGRGEYEDGEPGSPLLLSRCAEFVDDYRDVLCYFVEQNEDNFNNLNQVLASKGGKARRLVRHGSLDQHLPELLTLADGRSLFAFLDPFGPALDFATVKRKLLGRPSRPPTEVLLHFSVSSVARMGRAVHVARSTNGELPEKERRTADRLNRFLGGTWWRDYFAAVTDQGDAQRATDVALQVGAEYQRMLTSGTGFRAISMPVRPRPDLVPIYVLILFTRSGEGAWYFADSLGKAGLEWEEAWFEDRMRRDPLGQGTLFGEGPIFDKAKYLAKYEPQWVDTIAQNLRRLLDRDRAFRPMDRVPEVYGTVLGKAWGPHVRAAVRRLHAEGLVAHTGKDNFWRDVLRRT